MLRNQPVKRYKAAIDILTIWLFFVYIFVCICDADVTVVLSVCLFVWIFAVFWRINVGYIFTITRSVLSVVSSISVCSLQCQDDFLIKLVAILLLLKPHQLCCSVTHKLRITFYEMCELMSHYLHDFSLGIVQYSQNCHKQQESSATDLMVAQCCTIWIFAVQYGIHLISALSQYNLWEYRDKSCIAEE